MKNYVGIDIGGTAIKYGLIDENENITDKGIMDTQAHLGGKSILKKVCDIVSGYLEGNEIDGICISTAGMVDDEKGEIFYASDAIPGYIGTNFKKSVGEKFNIPCEVENDVNCAGLAEFTSGSSKGSKSALMLTVGTGIGGSIVIDGKIYRGAFGCGCEIGYLNMENSTFQELGATSVMTDKVARRKNEPKERWNGIRIFEEAKKGDEICISAIDEMTEILGKGIANICYVLNPDTVVLGGGIMAQKEYLSDKIQKGVNKYLLPHIAAKTKIVFAQHKNDAGMLGAFYHFRQRHINDN